MSNFTTRTIVLISLIFCRLVLFSAHTSLVDSLKKELLKPNLHDTDRINIYFQLVENIYDDNIWPEYNEQAYQLAQKILIVHKPISENLYKRLKLIILITKDIYIN